MAGDDKETDDTRTQVGAASPGGASSPGNPGGSALPPRVERALARAREAAKADRARKGGRWLAVIPVSLAVVLLLLLMPRATVPEAVPLPQVDERVLRDVVRADDARAAAAETTRLPADVLVVGTTLRALNGADARGADEVEMLDARRQLDGALRDLGQRADVVPDLLALRALQTRRFIDVLTDWEAGKAPTEDFTDLAAAFVTRAIEARWATGRRLLLSEVERRIMFKTVWNVLAGVETNPAFALTLDEQRALYVFYIGHPHPPDSRRLTLEADRSAATTPEACARVNREHARQGELWLAEKLKKLGEIDPAYPTAYALGVVYYRAGRFDLSADAFASFIGTHGDGAYALRARNHLKAVLVASETY